MATLPTGDPRPRKDVMLALRLAFVSDSPLEVPVLQRVLELAESRGHEALLLLGDECATVDAALYCADRPPRKLMRPAFVCLNGLDQGHARWPQPWKTMDWSRYDIGFLPGDAWRRRWQRSAYLRRSRPQLGVAMPGWPRSDVFAGHRGVADRRQGEQTDPPRTVLYAPSFECDGKQQELAAALAGTTHRLLIKHWNIPALRSQYPDLFEWIETANSAVAGQPNVEIIPPETDLYTILPEVDLLVTDQSSTIYDALAAGVPSLAVAGWPIRTSRSKVARPLNPSPDVTFVGRSDSLQRDVERALGADGRRAAIKARSQVFANFGFAGNAMLDIIESVVETWPSARRDMFVAGPSPWMRLSAPMRRAAFESQRFSQRLRRHTGERAAFS